MLELISDVFLKFYYYLPWYNFISDYFLLQFLIIYTMLLFYNSKNIYYTLLYLFILIFFFGINIALLQIELFTGFLWTIELTVLLIVLILFFYLNVEGGNIIYSLKLNNNFIIYIFIIFINFYLILSLNYQNLNNYNEINWLYFNYYYDDWYEFIQNNLMNDFITLTLSYYFINNVELILIGYLLLIASIVCVMLNRINKNSKNFSNDCFLSIFNFFSKYLNYSFIRKQILQNQNYYDPNIRIFKKKKW